MRVGGKSNNNLNLREFIGNYSTLLAYVVLFIVFGMFSRTFLLPTNLLNVLRQISMLTIMSIGLTYVLIVGEFDLSLGFVCGLLGVLTAGLLRAGYSLSIVVLSVMGLGVLIGAANGFFVVYGGIPAFIGTLAMGSIAFGVNFAYTDGYPVYEGITKSFRVIAEGILWFIPYPVIWMMIIVVIVAFHLSWTKTGRYFYATGENRQVALYLGINVNLYKMLGFVMVAVISFSYRMRKKQKG